jgi:hypothetical protein
MIKQHYDTLKQSLNGRKGALVRNAKYGNFGTLEGRRRGGQNSIKSQIASGSGSPFVARPIVTPPFSNDLAEFVGILLGDGHINENQISISLNRNDDRDYSSYVTMLIQRLFKFKPTINERIDRNVIVILISRKNVVKYLRLIGMKIGNKVRQQIDVPEWIRINHSYSVACVRGLVDTDGCMYIDKHIINNKLYEYLGLNFTNRSIPILEFVKSVWLRLNYHLLANGLFSACLKRGKEIDDYMQCVGSSNEKIVGMYEKFLVDHGRVPKRS